MRGEPFNDTTSERADVPVDEAAGVSVIDGRLVVRAMSDVERRVRTVAGSAAVLVGLGLSVWSLVAPGVIGEGVAFGIAVGALVAVGGLVSLATARRRLEVHAEGVTQRGLVSSRTIPSGQIERIVVDEHSGRTSGTFSRRVGGVRVGLGSDRGRVDLLGLLRWRRSVVTLEVQRRGSGGDIIIGVRSLDLDEVVRVVEEIRSRAHVPDSVDVEVSARGSSER